MVLSQNTTLKFQTFKFIKPLDENYKMDLTNARRRSERNKCDNYYIVWRFSLVTFSQMKTYKLSYRQYTTLCRV